MSDRSTVPQHGQPLLLGYLRSAVLGTTDALRSAHADLERFAQQEGFSLGLVFVDGGNVAGAFAALLEELARNEAARGIVIPDQRHLTCEEQLVLARHERGSRTPVLMVDPVPRLGRPGTDSPDGAGSAISARCR